jgi:hypothetical protein
MDGNAGGPSTNRRLPGSQIANLNDNKKSRSGVKTPPEEIAKVKARLKEAVKHFAERAKENMEDGKGRR